MGHIIGQLLTGLVVGAIAQILLIGNDPGGWGLRGFLITMAIGIAGSLVGTFAGKIIWKDQNYKAGWVMSIAGALLLLILFRVILRF